MCCKKLCCNSNTQTNVNSGPVTTATLPYIRGTYIIVYHAISFMSYDVSDLERFPISQEVMPVFFYPEHEFSFFDFSRV